MGSIDFSKTAYIYAAGFTLQYQTFWGNLEHQVRPFSDGSQSRSDTTLALGVGLPLNSWFQLSYTHAKFALSLTDNNNSIQEPRDQSSASASIGVTVFKGLAIEGEYTYRFAGEKDWSDEQQFGFGLSYRKL